MKKIYFLLLLSISQLSVVKADFWTSKATFSGSSIDFPFSFSILNKGYVGTGQNPSDSVIKTFWEYDPSSDSWTQKADFGGAARWSAIGFSIGNKGYAGLGSTTDNMLVFQDFWEYDPTANSWLQKADFGGGPRTVAVGFSIGNMGYAGTGDSIGNNLGAANDLWQYDPVADNWTRKASIPGVGIDDANSFVIGNNGYIIGGYIQGFSNLLWQYNSVTDSWSQKASLPAPGRCDAVAFSICDKGYFGMGEMGGGYGFDLWQYDPATNGWSQKTNFPSAGRDEPICFVINNNAYMGLGGQNAFATGIFYTDFWEYTPDSGCVILPVPSFQASGTSFCSGNCINFTNLSFNATSYLWSFPGGIPSYSSDTNPQNICYTSSGIYNVSLIASDSSSSDTVNFINYIKVFASPPTPVITQNNDTLYCSTNPVYASYQWYADTAIVPGATDTFYVALHNGNYNIAVTDTNGCMISVGINILTLPPAAAFQSSATSLCSNSCVNFTDKSAGTPIAWHWSFPGGIPSSSSDQNPQQICYPNSGIYTVTLVAANAAGSDTIVINNFIHVSPSPPMPVVTKSNDTLYCSIDPSYTSYQWYSDTTLIAGATNRFYVTTQGGSYHVEVTNEFGCNSSAGFAVGLQDYISNNMIYMYPNPAGDQLMIGGLKFTKETIIDIYNVLGQIILEERVSRSNTAIINVKNLAAGVYFVRVPVGGERGTLLGRFVK